MWAEAKYQDQTWVTCDYFSFVWIQQQQPREEALRVAREAHHWVLAMVAMLERHIKCLHCSISHGWNHSWEHPPSHQHSGSWQQPRSRGHSRSRRQHRSHRWWEALAESTGSWWPTSPSLVRTRRWMNSPHPVWLERWVTFEDLSSDPSLETTLKTADWSCPVGRDHPPLPLVTQMKLQRCWISLSWWKRMTMPHCLAIQMKLWISPNLLEETW